MSLPFGDHLAEHRALFAQLDALAQEAHIFIGHALCALVEASFGV